MIKGATEWVNPLTKEVKQKCICGAKLPLKYNEHFGCLGFDKEALLEARRDEKGFFDKLENDNNAEHQ